MAKIFFFVGIIFILVGLLTHFKVPFFWLGKLPGDFAGKIGNVHFYIPITTSIIFSIVISFLALLMGFIFRK